MNEREISACAPTERKICPYLQLVVEKKEEKMTEARIEETKKDTNDKDWCSIRAELR